MELSEFPGAKAGRVTCWEDNTIDFPLETLKCCVPTAAVMLGLSVLTCENTSLLLGERATGRGLSWSVGLSLCLSLSQIICSLVI